MYSNQIVTNCNWCISWYYGESRKSS